MQFKKQQLGQDMEEWTGSKMGKEYVKVVYCYLAYLTSLQSSVQFSCSVVSDSLQPRGLQHVRLPCPSPTPGTYSNSCPQSWWCHPTISSSVFPSCFQSFPASRSFPVSQFFTSSSQRILDNHEQVWVSLLWDHCSFHLGLGACKILFVPTKTGVSVSLSPLEIL